ncbi:MAG: response regulator [Holophagales bacterium]|jgi:two-component system chemotaxis response regulator CheY|nr:response regulator [Holophagales bacterium]
MIELQNLYICLVEPSNLQANIITRDLNGIGLTQISKVKNGEEALAAVESDPPPDVVMSSMYLSDMTGTDLLTSIRQQSSHPETPFVLVSSETDPRNLEGVRQAGVIALLPKPYTKVQLLRSVKNALDFLNADEEREESPDLKLSNLRVLIVDDSKIARKHIRTILERIGFEDFTEVVDGLEAIPQVENVLFDLVVTDYNMPNLDGLGLVDFIRNKSIQSSVPILMVSSLQDQDRLAAVMDAGVSAVFDKPFEINSVRQLVKQLFSEEEV